MVMMTCLHAYDRNVMDDVYLEIGFLTSYRTGRFLKIYENKASSIVSLQFDDICRSTLKVRTALLFTPCTKESDNFPEHPPKARRVAPPPGARGGCSARRGTQGGLRRRAGARGVATNVSLTKTMETRRSKGGLRQRAGARGVATNVS